MRRLREQYFVTRGRIVAAALLFGVLVLGGAALGFVQILRAHAQVAALRSLAQRQKAQLQSIAGKTAAIRKQLQRVQTQNLEIQRLIGVHPARKMSYVSRSSIDGLALAASQSAAESNRLRRLAMRLLNVHHLESLAYAGALAEIPSIDPVAGAPVVGCFCYRDSPDDEFHAGVDLGARYGDAVHATAAGTIVGAGWDGGFGLKVDIDHGNGYHTWYAHLSKIEVNAGQHVYKGQEIGLVGSTGFSSGPHLHYQVMYDGTPVDPAPYLDGVPAKVLAALP
jgi:murein DD-endopeptidase MepM/ murein hydrolase activator NlpD